MKKIELKPYRLTTGKGYANKDEELEYPQVALYSSYREPKYSSMKLRYKFHSIGRPAQKGELPMIIVSIDYFKKIHRTKYSFQKEREARGKVKK